MGGCFSKDTVINDSPNNHRISGSNSKQKNNMNSVFSDFISTKLSDNITSQDKEQLI